MANARFYRFSDNSSHTRGFTWAASIRPKSAIFRRDCSEIGVVAQYPIGEFDVVVEGGSRYPDILGCGAYPFLIVSESVVNAWLDAGVHNFRRYIVHVAEVRSKSKTLVEATLPHYYRIETDGRCEIDLEASGLEVVRHVPECEYLETNPSLATGFQMVAGSWDGSPLFRDFLRYPRVSFCTQSLVDLARIHRFTNFRFEPMEGPYDSGGKGVNYLGKL